MLYREAAVRVSQTVHNVSHLLNISAEQMFGYEKEGKVTGEQAGTHMHKVNVILEILFTELLDPIIAEYPDLAPQYCGCGTGESATYSNVLKTDKAVN